MGETISEGVWVGSNEQMCWLGRMRGEGRDIWTRVLWVRNTGQILINNL